VNLEQRFARLATDIAVRRPGLWRVLRRPLRAQFDHLAGSWDEKRTPRRLAGLEAALALLPVTPARALDLGTGTGDAALELAGRFPEAEIVGVDLAQRMVDEARRKTPPELAGRVRFERADASALPFGGGAFDLVALNNAIPFFDELARVLAPGGHVAFGFSAGAETPIYVPPDRLRHELGARGFTGFREARAGASTGFLARAPDRI
jgi:SAM-dependent methyltransferase